MTQNTQWINRAACHITNYFGLCGSPNCDKDPMCNASKTAHDAIEREYGRAQRQASSTESDIIITKRQHSLQHAGRMPIIIPRPE